MVLTEVRAQRGLARGLLACRATLRKPDYIRSQEFPGPMSPETVRENLTRPKAAL